MYKDQLELLEKGDGNEHSKKEAGVRHKELLEVAAPPVLEYIHKVNISLSLSLASLSCRLSFSLKGVLYEGCGHTRYTKIRLKNYGGGGL